jgi:hypothetical protein
MEAPAEQWEHDFIEMLRGQHRVHAADVPANRPPAVIACMHEIMALSGAAARAPEATPHRPRMPLQPLHEQGAHLNTRCPISSAPPRTGPVRPWNLNCNSGTSMGHLSPLIRGECQRVRCFGGGAREQMAELWRLVGSLEASLGGSDGDTRMSCPGTGLAAGHACARDSLRRGQPVQWSAVYAWIRGRIRRDAAAAFKLWSFSARGGNAQRRSSRVDGSCAFVLSQSIPNTPQTWARAGRSGGTSSCTTTPASFCRTPGPGTFAEYVHRNERVQSAIFSGRQTKRSLDMNEGSLSCSLSMWTVDAHEQLELAHGVHGVDRSTSLDSPCLRLPVDTTLTSFEDITQPTQPEIVAEQCCNRRWGAASLREQILRSEIRRERARSAKLEEVVQSLWGELTIIEEARLKAVSKSSLSGGNGIQTLE